MKALVLMTIFTLTAVFAQAETVTCTPPKNSNWQNAEISELENGTQGYLLHVKAWGNYLVADLICNFEKCSGFINGNLTEGEIEYSSSGPLKVISFTFENLVPDNFQVFTKFQCE
jgi:hypothetical protein